MVLSGRSGWEIGNYTMTYTHGEVWAVIPARGGSKGIPNKNLQTVAGIPLVSRSIRAAAASESIDQIIVSTDSHSIADLARKEGADVVIRPTSLALDTASSESAVLHAVETTAEISGTEEPEAVIMLQCTSPFLRSFDITALVSALRDHDCALTVTREFGFHWTPNSDGDLVPLGHSVEAPRRRRQDWGGHLLETGAGYSFRWRQFARHKHRFFGSIGYVETPPHLSIEIDEPWQLALAQCIASSSGGFRHCRCEQERIDYPE